LPRAIPRRPLCRQSRQRADVERLPGRPSVPHCAPASRSLENDLPELTHTCSRAPLAPPEAVLRCDRPFEAAASAKEAARSRMVDLHSVPWTEPLPVPQPPPDVTLTSDDPRDPHLRGRTRAQLRSSRSSSAERGRLKKVQIPAAVPPAGDPAAPAPSPVLMPLTWKSGSRCRPRGRRPRLPLSVAAVKPVVFSPRIAAGPSLATPSLGYRLPAGCTSPSLQFMSSPDELQVCRRWATATSFDVIFDLPASRE